ncbi:hypothetical protein SNEBB_010255 [Seison nebaliae]|nr:hypothetical protein SNEBB_010255 [Seison nebaliae]
MKLIIISILSISVISIPLTKEVLDDLWDVYKEKYDKIFNSIEEEIIHRQIYDENVKYIERHNLEEEQGLHTYRLGINQFTDLTNEQFLRSMGVFGGSGKEAERKSKESQKIRRNIPGAVDWRKKGYVTPVKNQIQCLASWAFSATGSLEGQWFKMYSKLVSLSEQNLVDCSSAFGNRGCFGGTMKNAFDYIQNNDGIDTEASYPFKQFETICKYKKENRGATLDGYFEIKSGDEDSLVDAVITAGPISTTIDASNLSFQLYDSGIYYEPHCSSTSVNHGALIVGYGSEDYVDYYIVKNSWGTTWGQEGYIYMARNRNNNCGIATLASYPLVATNSTS